MSAYLHIILWFLLIQALGLVCIPLVGTLGSKLADRGCSASLTLGIVLLTYLSWAFSYIWGFKKSTILFAFVVICLVSISLYKRGTFQKRFFPGKKILLLNEVVFLVGFFYFLFVRMYLPEIYRHEKFMDFSFLNAVMRTSSFPPQDPWFAGETLNFYYYFGYLSVGVPGKLCAVEPSVLFNLAIALTFALSLNLFFGIGYNLTHGSVKSGVITAVFGGLLGNLQGLIDFVYIYILKTPTSTAYYWGSSRVIPYTINEFPYFSFLHGDLHSHMLAIPFQLLVLTFLLNIYFQKNGNRIFENILALLVFSLSLGFLFPANSWDFPVYFGLMGLIIFTYYFIHVFDSGPVIGSNHALSGSDPSGSDPSFWDSNLAFGSDSALSSDSDPSFGSNSISGSNYETRKKKFLRAFFGFSRMLILISVFSFGLYLPFYMSFHPQAAEGLGILAPKLKTQIGDFCILFGFFLYLIFSFLILHLNAHSGTHPNFKQKAMYLIFLLGSSILLSIIGKTPLFLILLPLLVLSLISFLKALAQRDSSGFASILAGTAACLALLCEFVYLKDSYSGNYVRLNTVFKFYMNIWIFLAIAASYSYYALISKNERSLKKAFFCGGFRKKAWTLLFCFLLISCSFFPVVGTLTRIHAMKASPTLDGMEYMKELERGDYNAIKWIQENLNGTPVILEATSDQSSYTYTSRVSANTGLLTVLGWAGHERFWGRDPAEVRERIKDISTIYTTNNEEATLKLIKKYNISYVYIGQLENEKYGRNLDKFEDENYFELVYLGSVKIYKVKQNL